MALYESEYTGGNFDTLFNVDDTKSQSFVASASYTITSVKLKLSQDYFPSYGPSTLGVDIKSGEDVLCSGSISSSGVSVASYTFVEITLGDGAELSSGSAYSIVITVTAVYTPPPLPPFPAQVRIETEAYEVYGSPTLPGKPTTPSPANEASDITLDGTGVTWATGGNTDSYNVYSGILSGFLTLLESGVEDLSYTLRNTNWPLYGQVRYWRIDAVNENGTTTGDEWYFTTLVFYPPTPAGVTWSDPGNADGYTGTPLGTNNMLTCRRLVAAADNCLWFEV